VSDYIAQQLKYYILSVTTTQLRSYIALNVLGKVQNLRNSQWHVREKRKL